jgi:hypothetical protein
VLDDEQVQLAPQRMLRGDAEVAANIHDDGTDRPVTDFRRDLLRGGESGETVVVVVGGSGRFGAWRALSGACFGLRSCVKTRGVADDACFERLGAQQAGSDAGEDQCDVASAEATRVGGEIGGAVLLQRGGEFLAVIDELADEVQQAADAARCGLVDDVRSGGCGAILHLTHPHTPFSVLAQEVSHEIRTLRRTFSQ